MAVWSTVKTHSLSEQLRLDAEYYQPSYLRFAAIARRGSPFSEVIDDIIHPKELTRDYEDEGVPILLAQNIRPFRIQFNPRAFMPLRVRSLLMRSRLESGDVVMTRSGVNFGDTACFLGPPADLSEYFACADCLILKPKSIPAGYLTAYLNTRMGRALLTRGAYGAAQPHIAPNYLWTMFLPRIGNSEQMVHDKVVAAWKAQQRATAALEEAGTALESGLGLSGLRNSFKSHYSQRFSNLQEAHRYDAEYFSPCYQIALELLAKGGNKIRDVAHLAERRFQPEKLKGIASFQYIEIGSVRSDGLADSDTVKLSETPSRAQWVVEPGDVITSTVRPIRKLSAIITAEQSGYVCSSGFAVLTPKKSDSGIEPEVLLTFLRLPVICEILDLHTTASMYPAISTSRLMEIPIAIPRRSVREEVVSRVHIAFKGQAEAALLLQEAKSEVERKVLAGQSNAQ
jgi:hypothetical protein